jgi:hypothetical protein
MATANVSNTGEKQGQKFTVEFSLDAINALEEIKERLGKKSRADVLRSSLLLLKFLLDETQKGNQIAIISKGEGSNEKVKELALFV